MCLLPFSAISQIQQAWAVHYNNGILNGTNQAVKMTLDATGNIYVLGFSQNTNTNLGYVTMKYAPNGNRLWATRYDDTNYANATPSGFVLDASNNVVVTGNALTVKYDSNGNELWVAPYDGSSIAIDPSANPIVTGIGSNFTTAKLSSTGSNLWQTTYPDSIGPAWSQVVLVDSSSNVYVAGCDTYVCYSTGCYEQLLIAKYDPNGNQVWTATFGDFGPIAGVQVEGASLDGANNLYLACNFTGGQAFGYVTIMCNASGKVDWTAFPNNNGNSMVRGLALDKTQSVLLTGQLPPPPNYNYTAYGTYKLNTNGATIYSDVFPTSSYQTTSVGLAIATDSLNNCYVTGYSPGTNGTNDIVTIKYDQNGNQVWLQRYTSPSNANAAGNAIAVDNNGNVYVTGYDTTAAGGTEIVTIKYSPVTVQRRSDGTVILQAQGSPGESFDIEASTDLLNWLDLGSVQADTNGLMQFDDTNAPAYPARFYYTTPQ
jgi:hypothetical protein